MSTCDDVPYNILTDDLSMRSMQVDGSVQVSYAVIFSRIEIFFFFKHENTSVH